MSRRPDPATVLIRLASAVRARQGAEKALCDYWAKQWPEYDPETGAWCGHKPGSCGRLESAYSDAVSFCPTCTASIPLVEARKKARRAQSGAIRSAVASGVRIQKGEL